MNKEVLDSILPTMDTNDIVELVHNHLCGLRFIENKDREDVKVEYGLNENIEDNSREELNITIKKDNIIDGIMKPNGLYCLVAEPKVGKSFLALQLANSLVNNKQFLGFNTNPTSVLYVSTEISEL